MTGPTLLLRILGEFCAFKPAEIKKSLRMRNSTPKSSKWQICHQNTLRYLSTHLANSTPSKRSEIKFRQRINLCASFTSLRRRPTPRSSKHPQFQTEFDLTHNLHILLPMHKTSSQSILSEIIQTRRNWPQPPFSDRIQFRLNLHILLSMHKTSSQPILSESASFR